MPAPIVDANYRFIAGYQEVNARIAQRQQAMALYVTLIVGLLAALVALRPTEAAQSAPIEWLILGFPAAAICFAFLNHKAEGAITNLRVFLAALERLGDADKALPSYNADPRWSEDANKARRFHDYAAALLVGGGNLVGLGAAQAIHAHRLAEAPVFMILAAALAIGAFVAVLLTPRWSYSPRHA
jgi:hypothetical protein